MFHSETLFWRKITAVDHKVSKPNKGTLFSKNVFSLVKIRGGISGGRNSGKLHSVEKQDGNVPSRRHILNSKIFKEQLLEIFGKNFFSKKINFQFFSKKVFFKSHNAEKLKKRPFRLIQRFLQTENFKKMQGGTL